MTAIDIQDLMSAAEHGRMAKTDFLAGFLELMKQIQLFDSDSSEIEEGEEKIQAGVAQLQTASDRFSRLVLGLKTFQIRPDTVLHTKFICEMKKAENDVGGDLQSCLLYRGIAALYKSLQNPDPDGADMDHLQSNIWAAMHFSCRSLSRESELDPVLLKTAGAEVLDNDNIVARDLIEKLPPLSNRESSQIPHNVSDFLSLGTGADEYIRLTQSLGQYNPILAWNMVLHWILRGFPMSSGVHLILHPANLHIAQILTEWWSGKIDDVSIPMQFFKDFEIAISQGRIEGYALNLLSPPRESPLPSLEAPRDYQKDMMQLWLYEFYWTSGNPLERTFRYRYRRRASRSASIQRLSRAVYKSTLDELNNQSRNSASYGAPADAQINGPPENHVSASTTGETIGKSVAKAEAPNNLIHGHFYTPEQMTTVEVQRLTAMATHELGYTSGAILSLYPWEDNPKFPEIRGSKPYFLWDCKSGRTIKTESLPEDVQYTAISHTWGRWRKPTPSVSVIGVEDWKIPENTKFDVKRLPEILAQVPCDTDYLWFDLVCIPQNEPALNELAKREIGRQGMIFSHAKATIAWFNDVEGWKGVQAAIRQFCVEEMKRLGHPVPDGVVELLRREEQLPLELYGYPNSCPPECRYKFLPDGTIVWETDPLVARLDVQTKSSEEILEERVQRVIEELMAEIQSKKEASSDAESGRSEDSLELPYELSEEYFPDQRKAWGKMNAWFSSLWTLQEVCICPHMCLCDKSWQLLTISPSQQMKVELDSLIVIGGQLSSASPESNMEEVLQEFKKRPCLALQSLQLLMRDTGLVQLQNAADRATILALGSRRQCRSRRAEAIMSAVGITDWFTKQFDSKTDTVSTQLSKADLSSSRTSLDDYPEAFVKEAAQKIGARFYASSPGNDEVLWWLAQGDSATLSAGHGLGSMFPFTRYPSQHRYSEALDLDFTFGHPTVNSWVIRGRSVEIHEAAILSYTGQQGRSGTRNQQCTIDGLIFYQEAIIDLCFDHLSLDEWVDTFLPTTRNFALCVLVGPLWLFGILLKELSSGDLIKVGTFSILQTDARFNIETYKVDWRVL